MHFLIIESYIYYLFHSLLSSKYYIAFYDMVWYGMVWYGMVWYGMVWYGMVWYGMVWYGKYNIKIII